MEIHNTEERYGVIQKRLQRDIIYSVARQPDDGLKGTLNVVSKFGHLLISPLPKLFSIFPIPRAKNNGML